MFERFLLLTLLSYSQPVEDGGESSVETLPECAAPGCVSAAVVDSPALHWVIKSEGITGQLLAVLVIDERGFIC